MYFTPPLAPCSNDLFTLGFPFFKVIDIKEKLKMSKKFWSNLPEGMCTEERLAAGNASDDECWNGHTKGRWVVQGLGPNSGC